MGTAHVLRFQKPIAKLLRREILPIALVADGVVLAEGAAKITHAIYSQLKSKIGVSMAPGSESVPLPLRGTHLKKTAPLP